MSTTTMVLPTKVQLFNKSHALLTFGPGICEIPDEYADHKHLANSGAVKYDAKKKAAEAKLAAEVAAKEAAEAAELAKKTAADEAKEKKDKADKADKQ